jgi:hypothetical protein
MLMWLVPACLFCIVAAVSLGGGILEVESRGPARELLGLLATIVLYLVSWGVLQFLLARMVPAWLSMALASLISIPMFPAIAFAGFRIVGVKSHRVRAAAAEHGADQEAAHA